jgi:cyclase
MKRILKLCCLALFACNFVFAQEEVPKVTQVKENLFAISSSLFGNVAFLVTADGVLVVDAGNLPSDGNKILQIIKGKTDKPVKYLVLSHFHGDHVNGMQSFPRDVITIGQKNMINNFQGIRAEGLKRSIEKSYPDKIEKSIKRITELKANNSPDLAQEEKKLTVLQAELAEFKTIKIIDPAKTFDKDTTLTLGSDTIDIIFSGAAHTTDNSVIYFCNQRAVHTGDLVFEKTHPYIAWQEGTNTKNWLDFLHTMINDWQIDKVIPGHGTVADKELLVNMAEYLTDLRAEVGSAIKKGETLDEMKKSITMPQCKEFKRPYGLVQNIESIYHEMGGK